jgi:hypothetical protein
MVMIIRWIWKIIYALCTCCRSYGTFPLSLFKFKTYVLGTNSVSRRCKGKARQVKKKIKSVNPEPAVKPGSGFAGASGSLYIKGWREISYTMLHKQDKLKLI